MNTITLTAEQAEQVKAGVRELVIEGEPDITPDSVGAAFFAVLDHGKGAGLPHLFHAPKQWADADGQRVELRGPCPTCDGSGEVFDLDYKDPTRKMWDQCPECSSHGTVPVARATVEVLPVKAEPGDEPCAAQSWTHDGWQWFIWRDGDATPFDLPIGDGNEFSDRWVVQGRDFVAVLTDVELA